jgi:hypothetical protein
MMRNIMVDKNHLRNTKNKKIQKVGKRGGGIGQPIVWQTTDHSRRATIGRQLAPIAATTSFSQWPQVTR